MNKEEQIIRIWKKLNYKTTFLGEKIILESKWSNSTKERIILDLSGKIFVKEIDYFEKTLPRCVTMREFKLLVETFKILGWLEMDGLLYE